MDDYTHHIPGVMYVTTNIPGVGMNLEDFEAEFAVGCNCNGECNENCSCVNGIVNYVGDRLNAGGTADKMIMECHSLCLCSENCGNRLVQRGPVNSLKTFETSNRGLGLLTTKFIAKGQFICEYAGEVIGLDEAKRRIEENKMNNQMNYVLVVLEHFGQKKITTCIDPKVFGNIGRYCNHSCQPSASLVPVRVERLVPRLCLFAKKDIEVGEEITFDYADGLDRGRGNFSETRCLCSASGCTGFLPHHPI
uniref:Histone-lysine N-methyltransferase n=1 Tax=Bracon brevicornis TaxID=1563983 RepID=A0A6V7M2X1_9HYME